VKSPGLLQDDPVAFDLVRNPLFQLFERPSDEDLDARHVIAATDAGPHYTRKVHPLAGERFLNLFNGSHQDLSRGASSLLFP